LFSVAFSCKTALLQSVAAVSAPVAPGRERVDNRVVPVELSAWLVAVAGDPEMGISYHEPADRHGVLGESSGFVRADHCGGAQRFHRRELANQRILANHATHAQRKRDGDDRGQPFWDGGDRQANGHEEHFQCRGAAQPTYSENDEHDEQCGINQPAPNLLEPVLQWRGFPLNRLHQAGDAAQLGIHAGRSDDRLALAVRDQRAGKDHVAPIGQERSLHDKRVGIFLDRHRLAGEGGLIGLQRMGFDNLGVGSHEVASL